MTRHTCARGRPERNESLAAATEMALGYVLWCLREKGSVPWISRRAMREAKRLLHLSSGGPVPGWKAGAVPEYCEACGIDPVSGRIVDWERFYEALDRSSPDRVS